VQEKDVRVEAHQDAAIVVDGAHGDHAAADAENVEPEGDEKVCVTV
jgi:hypothetical protein